MRRSPLILAVIVPALAACSMNIFPARGPGLRELEQGEIHVQKVRRSRGMETYRMTYAVNAPLETAWNKLDEVDQWLERTALVSEILPVPPDEAAGPAAGAGERRYDIEWSSFGLHRIAVQRDDAKKMIDVRVVAGTKHAGRPNSCTVKMRPFLEASTLVEVKLDVAGDLLGDLVAILMSPVEMVAGSSVDARLRAFAVDLAEQHRDIPARPAERSGRTHIVAVGLNDLADASARRALDVEPLRWAEADAEAFYEWATAAWPAPRADGSVIRERLIGAEATSNRIRRVLNEIGERCLSGRVQPGDTVLFFFAGQVRSVADPLAAGDRGRGAHYPHLLTRDVDPDRIGFTAIKRSEVLAALRASPAARCLLFWDACFTDGSRVSRGVAPTRGLGPPPPDLSAVGPATAVFAASQRNWHVMETDDLGHGVFTHVLLRGLRGAADETGDGVSLGELKRYVIESVETATGSRQTPFVYTSRLATDEPAFTAPPAPVALE